MFETPETKGESSGLGMWVGILVVLAVLIGGIVFYMDKKNNNSSTPAPAAASASAAPGQTAPDAVKDLRIVSQKLDKDSTGTAVWTVELRNMSQVFTYSNIQYETTYLGPGGAGLGDNHGTIPSLTLDPGDSQSTTFRDAGYPGGTALFKIKVTGANAAR